jgi:hypothetical protein
MDQKIKVKFKLIRPGKSKLALIKAIHSLRHVTSWGLRESKDFVDSTDPKFSHAMSGILELNLLKSEVDQFRELLDACIDIEYELNDPSQLRNRKLIDLGLYDKSDLINELVDEDLFEILRDRDINKIREILIDRYQNLPEKYLKEKLKI